MKLKKIIIAAAAAAAIAGLAAGCGGDTAKSEKAAAC